MELHRKAKIALVVASLAALTIYFTARRRRKQRSVRSSCYLRDDQKPQYAFKRVLADNSYSAFKHLKLDMNTGEVSPLLYCKYDIVFSC